MRSLLVSSSLTIRICAMCAASPQGVPGCGSRVDGSDSVCPGRTAANDVRGKAMMSTLENKESPQSGKKVWLTLLRST